MGKAERSLKNFIYLQTFTQNMNISNTRWNLFKKKLFFMSVLSLAGNRLWSLQYLNMCWSLENYCRIATMKPIYKGKSKPYSASNMSVFWGFFVCLFVFFIITLFFLFFLFFAFFKFKQTTFGHIKLDCKKIIQI